MGLFDFLKVSVKTPPPKKAGPKPPNNRIQIDSKSFPINIITPAGLAATGFDGSLVKGQNARVSVVIDDRFAKFSFDSTVTVAEAGGDRLAVHFGMLTPETEGLIRKYVQLRKQGGK